MVFCLRFSLFPMWHYVCWKCGRVWIFALNCIYLSVKPSVLADFSLVGLGDKFHAQPRLTLRTVPPTWRGTSSLLIALWPGAVRVPFHCPAVNTSSGHDLITSGQCCKPWCPWGFVWPPFHSSNVRAQVQVLVPTGTMGWNERSCSFLGFSGTTHGMAGLGMREPHYNLAGQGEGLSFSLSLARIEQLLSKSCLSCWTTSAFG